MHTSVHAHTDTHIHTHTHTHNTQTHTTHTHTHTHTHTTHKHTQHTRTHMYTHNHFIYIFQVQTELKSVKEEKTLLLQQLDTKVHTLQQLEGNGMKFVLQNRICYRMEFYVTNKVL